MFRSKVLLFLTVITAVSFVSCSDDPSSIGSALLNPDKIDINTINSLDDSLNQQSSNISRVFPLGGSSKIFIGKTDELETVTLLRFRFTSFPDTLRTAIKNNNFTILSAQVELTQNYTYGTQSGGFDFSVHKISSSWTTAGFVADSLPGLVYEQSNAASNLNVTDSITTFDLDKQLVYDWLLAEADTAVPVDKGIFLQPVSVSGIRGYQAAASNNPQVPILRIKAITTGADTASLNFISIADISVVKGSHQTFNDKLLIQSGLISNARLKFEIPAVPNTALINNALLELNIDSSLTKVGSNYLNSLRAAFITDTSKLSLDSSLVVTLGREGNYFKGNITRFVQRWVNGETNLGILIWASGQFDGLEKFVLNGSTFADRTKQPKLTITYTYKKSL